VTPELAATLQTENTATEIPTICSITWISYVGGEGGIMCRLDFERDTETATKIPARDGATLSSTISRDVPAALTVHAASQKKHSPASTHSNG
jgi:hypothetical protein